MIIMVGDGIQSNSALGAFLRRVHAHQPRGWIASNRAYASISNPSLEEANALPLRRRLVRLVRYSPRVAGVCLGALPCGRCACLRRRVLRTLRRRRRSPRLDRSRRQLGVAEETTRVWGRLDPRMATAGKGGAWLECGELVDERRPVLALLVAPIALHLHLAVLVPLLEASPVDLSREHVERAAGAGRLADGVLERLHVEPVVDPLRRRRAVLAGERQAEHEQARVHFVSHGR